MFFSVSVEHLLSNLPTLHQVHRCHSKANGNLFYEFSIIHVDILFSIVPYHFLLSLYVIVVRIIATFSWNFLDLFIMLLTLSLAERFKQINMELYRIEGKVSVSLTFFIPRFITIIINCGIFFLLSLL